MYQAGFSVDRLYYGTDTRAQALLVGSFLGAVGSHRGEGFTILPTGWTATRRRRLLWTGLGVGGAVYLAWAWHTLAGQDPFLYRGGFLAVAVAAGAVIVGCVTVPASVCPDSSPCRDLVFVGRISYGLYLYHWPLFLAIDHAHTGLSGIWLLGTRLVVTFAVATVSFVLIEEPIRTGRAFRGRSVWASARPPPSSRRWLCWPPSPPPPVPRRPPGGGSRVPSAVRWSAPEPLPSSHPLRDGWRLGRSHPRGRAGVDSLDNYGVRLFDGDCSGAISTT